MGLRAARWTDHLATWVGVLGGIYGTAAFFIVQSLVRATGGLQGLEKFRAQGEAGMGAMPVAAAFAGLAVLLWLVLPFARRNRKAVRGSLALALVLPFLPVALVWLIWGAAELGAPYGWDPSQVLFLAFVPVLILAGAVTWYKGRRAGGEESTRIRDLERLGLRRKGLPRPRRGLLAMEGEVGGHSLVVADIPGRSRVIDIKAKQPMVGGRVRIVVPATSEADVLVESLNAASDASQLASHEEELRRLGPCHVVFAQDDIMLRPWNSAATPLPQVVGRLTAIQGRLARSPR